MDEPSNHVPCSTDSSSRWIGMVTALTWPMMSVNWSWTKRMPDAVAASILAVDSGLLANVDDASWGAEQAERQYWNSNSRYFGSGHRSSATSVSSSSTTVRSASCAGITLF